MQKQKEIWYTLAKEWNVDAIEKASQLCYAKLILSYKDKAVLDKITLPKKMRLGFEVENIKQVDSILKDEKLAKTTDYIFSRDFGIFDLVRSIDKIGAGLIINVDDRESLMKTVELAPHADVVIIEFKDPTNIPLELVLARTQRSETRIFKKVKEAIDGEVSFLTMESGADGILLASDDLSQIVELNTAYEKATVMKFNLQPAVVTRIEHAGMGDRVCIDTTSELTTDEGMILGSTSTGGILVCSETHHLPYMNLRPFRVNAGGMHMYVWGPDNMALYLSDLKAGDRLLVYNSKGDAREVTVGRTKTERRPLLLIEAKIGDKTVNAFIQDDWHVRVMGEGGKICPSAEVKVGDKLCGFIDEPGRHVGIKIDETIKEA